MSKKIVQLNEEVIKGEIEYSGVVEHLRRLKLNSVVGVN